VRIASKVNAALLGALACGSIATYATLNATIQPRFNDLERAEAQTNHKRVTEAFDTFTEKLETATHDYAFWDETYRLMQGKGVKEFIASNLMPEFKAVENLGVNSLIFLAGDGKVRWGAAYDLETQETIAGMVDEITQFSRGVRFEESAEPAALRGLIRSSKGLLLIAIAPALKSDGSGPPVGKVVSAKLLDVEAAKELTGVRFTLEPVEQLPSGTVLPASLQVETEPDRVLTRSVVNDLLGKPLARLDVTTSRDVSRTGAMAIRSALIMMILAALASMAILWMYLRSQVVSRIERLKSHFATAGESGTIKAAALGGNKDEIGDMARSFNAMADQVNHLRDALADSAYMSGLSEWAAGTLHNVRNGLAPVATSSWQIEQLFDPTWVRNVETATDEHASPETAPDRREKLNTFLVGSASRLAAVARKATLLTGQINDASRSVLDIVAEFERYAHRKTELESIDLLSVINSVASTTIVQKAKGIELVLPDETTTVSGNGIILRQVISNVLLNAMEAVEGKAGGGRIEVSITRKAQQHGTVRLAITDNGEGLAPEHLASIFQRGRSTRRSNGGGLGLHWCANAIKVLGGTIRAESDGAGHGTTIIIELPVVETPQKAAA
jgi:signal transduction histidine kinase